MSIIINKIIIANEQGGSQIEQGFYCFEKKSCFTLACDNQHQPPLVHYTPTTRQ